MAEWYTVLDQLEIPDGAVAGLSASDKPVLRGKLLQLPAVDRPFFFVAAHILPKASAQWGKCALGIADVWDERNGLLWAEPFAKAYHAHEMVVMFQPSIGLNLLGPAWSFRNTPLVNMMALIC
ncbi:hypothetical protein WJX79_006681 [Trebouxia sp. C0005]